MNKTRAQRVHARKRALQRYGLDATKHVRRAMEEAIRSGDRSRAELIVRQSWTRRVFKVVWQEQAFFVVYDKLRGQIATFLTEEMAMQAKKEAEFALDD